MNLVYTHSFIPPLIGCVAGLLYGCSFILQHKSMFTSNFQEKGYRLAFFLLRIGILFMIGNYLLQMALIPSILGSIGFFGMFWLIILQAKAKFHERN